MRTKLLAMTLLFGFCAWATESQFKADHLTTSNLSVLQTAIPGSCSPGDVRYSSADNKIKVCNGSSVFVDPSPFTAGFDSGEVAFSNGTVVAVNHGLGALPTDWKVIARNKVAELGYAVGDEVQMAPYAVSGNVGSSVWANSTQIGMRVGSCIIVSNRSGLADNCMTAGNWRLVFRGWK